MFLTDFQKEIVSKIIEDEDFLICTPLIDFLDKNDVWISIDNSQYFYNFLWTDQETNFVKLDNPFLDIAVASGVSEEDRKEMAHLMLKKEQPDDEKGKELKDLAKKYSNKYYSSLEIEENIQRKFIARLNRKLSELCHLIEKLSGENLIYTVYNRNPKNNIFGHLPDNNSMKSRMSFQNDAQLKPLRDLVDTICNIDITPLPELKAFQKANFLTEEEVMRKGEISSLRKQTKTAIITVAVTIFLSLITSVVNIAFPSSSSKSLNMLTENVKSLSNEISELSGSLNSQQNASANEIIVIKGEKE